LRSFLLVLTNLTLHDYPTIQVHCLLTINLGHAIFIAIVKPYDEY
jgi:hypothetical protein